MKLSPEVFERIAGFKEGALGPSALAKQEHRSAPRVPLAFRTIARRIIDGKYGPPLQVQVRDFSATGLGLLHAADVDLGRLFVVCLKPRGGTGKLVAIRCELRRSEVVGQAVVRAGAEFLEIIPDSEPSPCAAATGTAAGAAAGTPTGAARPASRPSSPQDEVKRIRDALLD